MEQEPKILQATPHQLIVYVLASIGLREKPARSRNQILATIPKEDGVGEVMQEQIFGNTWYEACGYEIIENYFTNKLSGLGGLVTYDRNQDGYTLTSAGRELLEDAAEIFESNPSAYPHLNTIFKAIIKEEE